MSFSYSANRNGIYEGRRRPANPFSRKIYGWATHLYHKGGFAGGSYQGLRNDQHLRAQTASRCFSTPTTQGVHSDRGPHSPQGALVSGEAGGSMTGGANMQAAGGYSERRARADVQPPAVN